MFPPGGTCSPRRTRSHWREFSFALHELQRAIEPQLALSNVIQRWPDIERALAERPRKRLSQSLS